MVSTRPGTGTRSALRAGIPPRARLHVLTGKGGTGKTTAAAALAIAIAGTGAKVLLVEVEGRQAIAQLFGVPALPYSEQRLLTAQHGGSLWGLAVDAEEAMLEYLEMFYGLKRSARGLQRMGAVDFVTTLAPGLRDVLLTGKVKEAVSRTDGDGHPSYDAVVLDAPPSGRVVRFLDATREVASLARIGPISRQSEGVVELLHSDRTAVHLVTLLEQMAVQEALDAAAQLRGAGFRIGAVFVNRTQPAVIDPAAGPADEPALTGLLTRGLPLAGLPPSFAAALAAQLVDQTQRQAVQAGNARRLGAVTVPRIELPDLAPPVEVAELHELAQHLVTHEGDTP